MVTYNLRRVCGGRTANLISQTVRRPYGFYASRSATSRFFLVRRKVITSLAVFFNNTMVTYSLRRVCGGRTATLVPQTAWQPYGFYARFLARCKVIASLASFFNLTLTFFSETAMPQRPNHTARSPYGGRAVTLRWPWAIIWFLPYLGCLENRTAASRRPCGGLTAPLRRPYGKRVVTATTVSSPHGQLPVSLRSLYDFLVHESYDRRAVFLTFVTTTNYRSLQDLTTFKNHVLQTVDGRTVRRPCGGSMIWNRGTMHMDIIQQHFIVLYMFYLSMCCLYFYCAWP